MVGTMKDLDRSEIVVIFVVGGIIVLLLFWMVALIMGQMGAECFKSDTHPDIIHELLEGGEYGKPFRHGSMICYPELGENTP